MHARGRVAAATLLGVLAILGAVPATASADVILDTSGCTGSALAFGPITTNTPSRTASACRVVYGSNTDVAGIRISQLDGTGAAFPPFADYQYGVTDFDQGASTFGACLQNSSGSVRTWTVDPNTDCTASDTDPWNSIDAVSTPAAEIAHTTASGINNAWVDLRFGVRTTPTQTAGPYSSDLVITVLAPNLDPPSNTALPVVTGTTTEGSTLSSTTGTWTGSPTFTYQWRRCDSGGGSCVDIGGATSSTYLLQPADVGSTIRSRVTGTNAAGSVSADSAATAIIQGRAPVNTVAPAISGTRKVGNSLTVSNGTWTGTATINYTYQWQLCDSGGGSCVDIVGATSATYAIADSDVDHTLQARVTATNVCSPGCGTASATAATAPTVIAGRPPTSGGFGNFSTCNMVPLMPYVGEPATTCDDFNPGVPAAMTITYQWRQCNTIGFGSCTDIPASEGGTQATYTPTGYVGKILTRRTTATNSCISGCGSDYNYPYNTRRTIGTQDGPRSLVAMGFEDGTTGRYTNNTGSPQAVQAPPAAVRTGYWGFEATATGGAEYTTASPVAAVSSLERPYAVTRFYVKFPAAPSVTTTIASVQGTAGADLRLSLTPARQIQLDYISGSGIGAAVAGPTLTTNAWHQIDLRSDMQQSTYEASWMVDGTPVTPTVTQTAQPTTARGYYFRLGVQTNTTFTAYYDDWQMSTEYADYPLGDGSVSTRMINGVGTHSSPGNFFKTSNNGSSWTVLTGADSNSYTLLDDWPPTVGASADAVSQQVNGGILQYNLAPVGGGQPPTVVSPYLSLRQQMSGPNVNMSLSFPGGASPEMFWLFGANNTSLDYGYTGWNRTPNGLQWTTPTFDAQDTEWSRQSAGDAQDSYPRLDSLMFQIDQPAGTRPANTVAPTVTGTLTSGSTLTANNGTWTGGPSYDRQWLRCDATLTPVFQCDDIPGAHASTYVLTAADVGFKIRAVVIGSNANGATRATTAATGTVT